MKKLLSLFVLLVAIVTGANAAGYKPSADEVIILKDVYSANATTAGYSTHAAIAWEGTASTNSKTAGDPNNGGAATSSNVNCYSVKGNGKGKNITVSVTGVSKIIIYHEKHSSRYVELRSGSKDGTLIGKGAANTYYTEVELNASTDYSIFLHGTSGSDDTDFNVYAVKLIKAETKTVATQTFAGVKVGETTLTENATTEGYSISEGIITLTDDLASAGTPDNVKLIDHITYTDSSTENTDVDVTFDGTVTSGYFVGSATIGLTGYTVKVKKDDTPTLTLSTASADVTLKSYEVVKANGKNLDPVKVTLTGANLADGEYNVSAEGLTISPSSFVVENGEVSQEFSINTTSTTAASTEINFTVGELTETFTLNLTRPAKRSVTQSVVTEATTWDWANASSEEVLLTKVGGDDYTFATDPARDVDFLMATLPEVNNDETFNSQALVLNTQYVKRTGNYFQGSSVAFKTNLSGQYKVTVKFANTGKRDDEPANRRYLYIDGTNTDVYTLNTDWKTATATLTLDGDEKEIVINAFTGAEEPAATMVRIKEITFAPIPAQDITVGETGFATIGLPFATTVPAGVTAYAVESVSDSKVTTSAAIAAGTTIPANQGFIITAAPNTYTFTEVAEAEYTGTNILAAVGATAKAATAEAPIFVFAKLSDSKVGFKKATSGSLGAYKAYLPGTVSESNSLSISFEGEATAINNVNANDNANSATPVKVIKNGKLYIGNFNVAGQQVK